METVVAREPNSDSRALKENVLRDFVRFSWRATRGLTSAATNEGETLVRKMVETGRVTPFQGERLLTVLNNRLNVSRETFERRIDESIRRAADRIGELSAREADRFHTELARLEERVNRLHRM